MSQCAKPSQPPKCHEHTTIFLLGGWRYWICSVTAKIVLTQLQVAQGTAVNTSVIHCPSPISHAYTNILTFTHPPWIQSTDSWSHGHKWWQSWGAEKEKFNDNFASSIFDDKMKESPPGLVLVCTCTSAFRVMMLWISSEIIGAGLLDTGCT